MLSSEPAAARFWLLGASESVLRQSYKHPDGTGLAYYVDHQPTVEKYPIAAYRDREFAAEARNARSHLFVAHVRHATRGRVSLENTQPFVHDSFVFAHNGTIEDLENIPDSLGPFQGETDSERYFAVLLHHIREASNTLSGIRKGVDWIRENCTYTSLNFLLADGECLYALRLPKEEDLYVRHLEAEEGFRGLSSYGSRTERRHHSTAVLFASEEVDAAPSWRELEPGTLAVAHPDLQLELHHI